MNIFVRIITDDQRFERLLALELSSCGIPIFDDEGEPPCGEIFTLLDLDFFGEELSELAADSRIIGFSHRKREETACAEQCFAFIHRPFLMSELLSLILSQDDTSIDVKRSVEKRAVMTASSAKRLHLSVDPDARTAIVGKDKISLTDTEYKILSYLCTKRGEIVSRDELSLLLGSHEGNNADVYICMLRRKIDNKFGMKFIYTVRGKGYMLRSR